MRVVLILAALGAAFFGPRPFSEIAYGQGMGRGEQSQLAQQETRKTPAMRERVYSRLSEAQECADEGDMECARELLDRVREMSNLNSYEVAQMWNFYAFIYFSQVPQRVHDQPSGASTINEPQWRRLGHRKPLSGYCY